MPNRDNSADKRSKEKVIGKYFEIENTFFNKSFFVCLYFMK